MLQMLGNFAEFERALVRERTRMGCSRPEKEVEVADGDQSSSPISVTRLFGWSPGAPTLQLRWHDYSMSIVQP